MQLEWKSHADLSAMHVAWCVANYPEECQHCDPNLRVACEELSRVQASTTVPASRFWEQLFTLAVHTPGNRDLSERMLSRCSPGARPTPMQVNTFATAIGGVEANFGKAYPNFEHDMKLRMGPLRQQFESMAPGLLNIIAGQTERELLVESATIYLVPPVVGGYGQAHLHNNSCHMEGLLTDVDPSLPEVLRLVWLVTQLDFDRPVYSDQINQFRLSFVAALAMLPPVLIAAEELGVGTYHVTEVERAIRLWRLPTSGKTARELSMIVSVWWDTYSSSRPAWATGLTALDQMLG